jgi:hypothetical protein
MHPATNLPVLPQLYKDTSWNSDQCIISSTLGDFHLDQPDNPHEKKMISQLLAALNGEQTTDAILATLTQDSERRTFMALLQQLDQHGLINDTIKPETISALEALFQVEQLINQLLIKTVDKNPFWEKMDALGSNYPKSVLYGFAIENYHFLFREALFDSPILSYQSSTQARLLMNEFYVEEIGHDKLLLKSLESIGLSESILFKRAPLAATMMMCHALMRWAATDPLFFFVTLGLLEGNGYREDGQLDSYISACYKANLPETFISPIETHAKINLHANHGNLSREIMQANGHIPISELQRLKSKAHLFVELYNIYYQQIWDHYQNDYFISR